MCAPGSSASVLRLSNRHYVNWHVQCNSLIRLNEEKCYLLTAPRGPSRPDSLLFAACQLSQDDMHVAAVSLFLFFNIEQLEVSIYIATSIKAFCIFPRLSTTLLYIFYQNMFSGPQLLPPSMCNTNNKGINLSELRSLSEKLSSHACIVNSELN